VTKPNRRAEEAGYTLQTIIAANISNALDHLTRELSVCDGFGERGESVSVSSSTESTTTERAMMARYQLTEMRESLRDALNEAIEAINRLNWTTQQAMRIRSPRDVVQPKQDKLCRDGITDATRQGSLEWHDPTCMKTADKLGLCSAHYMARRRWAENNAIELPEAAMLAVVHSTLEVLVRDGYGGAVHVVTARATGA
jgi:hypothetical protein